MIPHNPHILFFFGEKGEREQIFGEGNGDGYVKIMQCTYSSMTFSVDYLFPDGY